MHVVFMKCLILIVGDMYGITKLGIVVGLLFHRYMFSFFFAFVLEGLMSTGLKFINTRRYAKKWLM